ncbi:MFS transporter [Streptomyces achromogenes]|uniref:MFS transporter n=1 Tax=Streptomyces achromogenes TaxID=67255 RepID=A0ABZ1KSW5_STRAH
MTLRATLPPAQTGTNQMRHILVATGVDALGTGCYLAVAPLYLLKVAGLSASETGVAFSVSAVVGMVCSVFVGRASELTRVRHLLPWLYGVQGVCFLLFPLMGSLATALVVMSVVATAERATAPVRAALISDIAGADRHLCIARMRTVQNVSFAAAGLLVIPVLVGDGRSGYTAVTVINTLSFFVAAFFLTAVRPPEKERVQADGRQPQRLWTALRDRRVLTSMTVDAILYLHVSVFLYLLPVWIATETRLPKVTISVVFVANAVVVGFLQTRVSKGLDSIATGRRAMIAAAWLLTGSCLFLLVVPRFPAFPAAAFFTVAMVLLTAAEMLHSGGRWAVSLELAPPDRRASFLATFNMGLNVQTILGPMFLTAVVLGHDATGWLGLGGIFLVAGLIALAI